MVGSNLLCEHSKTTEGLGDTLKTEKQGMSYSTDLCVLCNKARQGTERYTKPRVPHCTKANGTTRTHAVFLLLSVHGLELAYFNFQSLCVCSGNFSSAPKHNPNRKTIEFSDWLHMECLQRPTVHLGWLSSFFKTIWSLLKLSLFKEPAEREESNLGLRRKRRNKI